VLHVSIPSTTIIFTTLTLCSVPPAVADKYMSKGKYIDVAGLQTYVTGNDNADTAILVIYDIFGFFPQIIQGADILAHTDKQHAKQVFMPDFFNKEPADIAWYPPDTKEKEEKLGEWFKSAAPPKHLPKIAGILEECEKVNPNIKKWGVIGYCWGKFSHIATTRGHRLTSG
jgi:dienelactone hydrolase